MGEARYTPLSEESTLPFWYLVGRLIVGVLKLVWLGVAREGEVLWLLLHVALVGCRSWPGLRDAVLRGGVAPFPPCPTSVLPPPRLLQRKCGGCSTIPPSTSPCVGFENAFNLILKRQV